MSGATLVSAAKENDMPDRVRVTEGQMRLILFAVEHGFRECERGKNLQGALASVHAMYRIDEKAAALTTPEHKP